MTYKLSDYKRHNTKKDGRLVYVYYEQVGDEIHLKHTVYADTRTWADFDTNGEQQQLKQEIKAGVTI